VTKLNSVVYRKLVAQAEEAKAQGLTKLASNIMEAIGDEPAEELKEYSYTQMENDIHGHLWKVASHVMKYYNVSFADVQKLDKGILLWASELIDEVEHSLGVGGSVKGPLEPKLPGENK
jgi:thermostable 8-oxoguanine DNA glycosylase